MIAMERWTSGAAFRAYAPKASRSEKDEYDPLPRQRVILETVGTS